LYIIAEIGVNHDGDLGKAKELIDCASDAGANAVKFQTFSADELVTPSGQKAAYQFSSDNPGESQLEMLRKLELSRDEFAQLFEYSRSRSVDFLSSAFGSSDLLFLLELGMNIIKIPSGEITNGPYLDLVGSLGRSIFLSTGMSTLADVDLAIARLLKNGASRESITVMHCTSCYPTALEDVNLNAMVALGDLLQLDYGYSDHTIGSDIAIAAAALGASVFEKHITLDRGALGPDHAASMEPGDFCRLVNSVRNVTKALGSGIKKPTELEMKNSLVVRRSIVAGRAIKKGEIFTTSNLKCIRPGSGLSPMMLDTVLGLKASRNFDKNEMIRL
jgi:N,N'-diacetyllegionaminate synthase